MAFLTFSNTDVSFAKKKFTWNTYITAEALLTTKQVKFINKQKFVKAMLNNNSKTFVVHVTFLSLVSTLIHLDKED